MRLPTNNWVTCNTACHGYLATDYSWHVSRWNYLPRKKVYAPEDGIITYSGKRGDCGLALLMAGQKSRGYGMCHFERIYVRSGDKVKEGQVIGIMGNTGRSTGVHLHLTMTIKGKRVDPDKTIRALVDKEGDIWKAKYLAALASKKWYKNRYYEALKSKNFYKKKRLECVDELNKCKGEK